MIPSLTEILDGCPPTQRVKQLLQKPKVIQRLLVAQIIVMYVWSRVFENIHNFFSLIYKKKKKRN